MGIVADDDVALAEWARTMTGWYLSAFPRLDYIWYWVHDDRIAAAHAAGYVRLIEQSTAYSGYGRWCLTEQGMAYLRPLAVLRKLRDEE